MRLILSRKGFDSSAGGCPSPLFPDGRLLALPIPDERSPITYGELQYQGENLGTLAASLTGKPDFRQTGAHLDPDLVPELLPRHRRWRPLLGQEGPAQGHLCRQGVTRGDLFLFFGLFRPVQDAGDGWRFVPGAPAFHALWGWLQIGDVHPVDEAARQVLPWAHYHPHFHGARAANNTLYTASDELVLPERSTGWPAAGIFPQYTTGTRLTAPDAQQPSRWRLPAGFFPGTGRTPLSYHHRSSRWRRAGRYCHLDSAARGQEFVLDTSDYPGVRRWLWRLFRS